MGKRMFTVLMVTLLVCVLVVGCGPTEDTTGTTTTTENHISDTTTTASSGDTTTEDSVTTTSQQGGTTENTVGGSTTTTKKQEGTTTTTVQNTKFDVSTAPMPSRDVANKTLTYYSWAKLEDSYGKTAKSLPNIFKQEFGIKLTGVFSTHDTYWEDLAKLKASGQSPDLVDLPNWNFYPLPITEELIQPLDTLIDFSNPLWDDTKTIRENNKWKGKTYVAFMSETLQTWFIYNPRMFRDNGLSKKTPRTYYEQDAWTWDVMYDLAEEFVEKDGAGEATQWGLTIQTGDLIASTGVELVQGDGKGGYIYNLKDAKVAKMMNLFYDMGIEGNQSLYTGDAITGFKSGKVAMIITNASTLLVDFNEMREAGNLDWVPLPKMDEKSTYYNQSSFDPGWGIAVGAKNPEGAALFIEFAKWWGLGYNFCSQIPVTTKNAATIKFNLKDSDSDNPELTAEQIAWTQSIMDKNYKNVSIMWQSWLGTQVLPGYGSVTSGAKKWSAALEEEFPATDALLQSYVS